MISETKRFLGNYESKNVGTWHRLLGFGMAETMGASILGLGMQIC